MERQTPLEKAMVTTVELTGFRGPSQFATTKLIDVVYKMIISRNMDRQTPLDKAMLTKDELAGLRGPSHSATTKLQNVLDWLQSFMVFGRTNPRVAARVSCS